MLTKSFNDMFFKLLIALTLSNIWLDNSLTELFFVPVLKIIEIKSSLSTFVALYLVVFTATTIPYSYLSKVAFSWKLYFPYPLVWLLGRSTEND